MKRQKVHVTTLDGFFSSRAGEAPAFVKMDIEGFEEQALLGGKKTIASCKPILSFSAYHKPTDKEVLPRTVRSIREDYSCTLHSMGEEDFYCD
jgi:hypothetical protein